MTIRLVIVFISAFIILSFSPAEARRVALVIGNSAYQQVPQLTNPRRDAKSVAEALKKIGFEEVRHVEDQDQSKLLRALRDFQTSSSGAEISLIYFAGHGVEVNGKNYLVPVDASLSEAAVVDYEGITLDQVRSATSRATKLRLVILDACRNNPFKFATSSSMRSVNRGLAIIDEPAGNELIAYAARAGTVASDGPGQANSPYAAALIKYLEEPGLDVRQLFGKVRDEVFTATSRTQEPFTYGSLGGQAIVLNEAINKQIRSPAPSNSADAAAIWSATKDTQSIAVLQAFAKDYPDSTYARMAMARIEELKIDLQSRSDAGQEARRKAEEAKRAEEEALRQAELIRKAADQEARRKADEQQKAEAARKAAEEEARKKAEIARKAAEQEARRKAEEEKKAEAARLAELQRLQKEEADRKAAEEATSRKAQEAEQNRIAAETQLKFETLAKSIQVELKRIGCDPGKTDGKWRAQAKEALRRVPKLKLAKATVEIPTDELLNDLKAVPSNICPLVCDDDEVERNGKCVTKPKPKVLKQIKDKPSTAQLPLVESKDKSKITSRCEKFANLCRGNGSITTPICPDECRGQ